MTLFELGPILGVLAFLVYNVHRLGATGEVGPRSWVLPAVVAVAFLAFSLVTVAAEGLVGIWENHSRDFWGNQVWLDLLIAISMAFTFMAPEARRLGMRPGPWLAATCLTGCIGLLAMLSRMLWLKARAGARAAPALS